MDDLSHTLDEQDLTELATYILERVKTDIDARKGWARRADNALANYVFIASSDVKS